MSEERLKTLEGYMEQLNQMVEENNKDIVQLKETFKEERLLNQQRHEEFKEEKMLNQQRHEVLLKELRNQNVDVEYLRDQGSKHDMKINRLKTAIQ
ncbi:hypothetical protein HNR44_002732 [Geomicrobium halophilum]|uniref:Uncharacterized protein n=1 Tax=Geomicrobium halophilum TaxID=549000 RepID=A0A841Q075_9BACL|nr:hypothetical protein [Geomicrobium halophilum]MBB6450742.1 hypothetical protein [Geomicrobium halophilum]